MANQESIRPRGLKGLFFKANTPTKERTGAPVREPEVAPYQTSTSPDRLSPKKKGERIKLSHRLRNTALAAALTLTGVEGTGAVVKELTNEQPASVRTIPADLVWPYTMVKDWLHKEIAVPSNFDKDAKEGVIGVGINTITVSQEAFKSAYDKQVNENKDGHPTVIFPAIFTASGQKIAYEYQKPYQAGTDSQTGQPVILDFPGRITLHPDKGEEIPVIAENAEVFQFQHVIIAGKEYFVGFFIKFQQNGELYGLRIAPADVLTFSPLGEVSNVPIVPTNEDGTLLLSEAKSGLKLSLQTVLSNVNLSNAIVYLNFDRYNPETGRWESVKPNFVTDNSTGTTKLPMTPTNP